MHGIKIVYLAYKGLVFYYLIIPELFLQGIPRNLAAGEALLDCKSYVPRSKFNSSVLEISASAAPAPGPADTISPSTVDALITEAAQSNSYTKVSVMYMQDF